MMIRRQSFEDLGQKYSRWKEQKQRPEMKTVTVYLRGWKEGWCGRSRMGKGEAIGE